MPSIIVASGPKEGAYYPLSQQAVVIGRDAKCPIQILDDLISRVHLQIRYDKERKSYCAEDLKSANGVTINGRRLTEETPLANGDLLELGNTKLMFFTRDFPDKTSAWEYYKIAGERTRGTLVQSRPDRPSPGVPGRA